MDDPAGRSQHRRLPALGGLRVRLALTISLIVVGLGLFAFLAVDRATRAELENRVDEELEEQYSEFRQHVAGVALGDRAEARQAAESFLSSQRYHAESRIFLIDVGDGRQITNHPEILEREIEEEEESREEEDDERRLLFAPEGLADVDTEEAGELRVLTRPIVAGGRTVGAFRVADPLESVAEAQEELRNAFLLVGAIAIVAALAAATLAASRFTAPLRRMAETAAAVDAGDLSPRLEEAGADEMAQLARSFNGMLDRLERAFERERAFVSDASHELRTPLTILRGQVELLGRLDADPEERRRILESLPREIAQMSRLVDEMLVLARAEDGRFLSRRRFDLGDFLADLERDAPLLGDREYRVVGPRAGTLEADPDRLQQVFRNLLRNAVQHTGPDGEITVAVKPDGDRLEFAVTDTGPGIPPDQVARVFERFHRVDESRSGGGSGLGLAIARAIVEAHSGSIRAESRPGEGTTIRFRLPGYAPPLA